MNRPLLSLLFTAFAFVAYAGDVNYAANTIPAQLLKKANVVKRMENIHFEINSTKSSTLRYKYALTVLNENGDRYATFVEWYDKLRQIVSIEGSLYDASGKQIKKLKSKDIVDLSAVDDISLIDDNRKKVHSFYYRVYPYTIEYEVEVKYNNTFHFPSWIPQEYEFLAVEKSSYSITSPIDYEFRYKSHNFNEEPVKATEKNKKTFTWKISNVPAIVKEPFSPRWHELTPMISLAPTDFEIQGYKGNMSNWSEFGKFLYELKKGKDELPENVKQIVKQICSNNSGEKEKVKALYEYLQKNTRYISIQLGLGGWQPFDASYVAKKGYGDCKALSNFMYSLLKEAGIKSYYALIKAGQFDYFLQEDFPSNQFNHAILFVPMQKDTMWLECTSQSTPAGYMGNHTGNRKALIIDENGGTLVNTPIYDLDKNIQARKAVGVIGDDGTLNIKVSTDYKAIQQDYLHSMITSLSKDKVKEILQEELELSTYHINNFKYDEIKDIFPEIREQLDITVQNFATITGKRLYITPNLLNKSSNKINADEQRKYDLCFHYAYKDVDSVEIQLPKGYEIEAMPSPTNLKTKFGNYSSQLKLVGDKLFYVRTIEQFAGRYPAGEYKELDKYFSEIYKADRSKIVLVKN